MYNYVFETGLLKLEDLKPSPIKLTINSVKKITELEKIARMSIASLPPIEVAILENGKKYIVKGHSVFEVLQKTGHTHFRANIHHVKDVSDAVILHARMTQFNPINPLAILEMRDYLMNNGLSFNDIITNCLLDPAYVNLLKCDLSPQAKDKLSLLIDMLSLKLSRVEIPTYLIEMISRRPKEIQEEIVDRIRQYIGDEKTISDRDFIFPNQAQIKLYTEITKKPERRNILIFKKEEDSTDGKESKRKGTTKNTNKLKDDMDVLIADLPHLALMEINGNKFRLNWKTKTFTKINDWKNEFILMQDDQQLKKIFTLTQKQLEFLNLTEGQRPYFCKIDTANQLRTLADRMENEPDLKVIAIFNKIDNGKNY